MKTLLLATILFLSFQQSQRNPYPDRLQVQENTRRQLICMACGYGVGNFSEFSQHGTKLSGVDFDYRRCPNFHSRQDSLWYQARLVDQSKVLLLVEADGKIQACELSVKFHEYTYYRAADGKLHTVSNKP